MSHPERPLVTIHLPIEMGCGTAVMRAVARVYPDARIHSTGANIEISADPDLTMAERRANLRARRAAAQKAATP